MRDLSPTDRIALVYAIALAAVAAQCGARPPGLIPALASLAAAIVAIARFGSASRIGRVVHDFAPIALIPALYGLSGPVVAAANPARWDPVLAALDRAWFGALPAAWIGLWGRPPWLTEVASLFYAAYYAIPIAIAIALYRGGRRAEFDSFVFAATATFLASYVMYFMAPADGPRLAHEAAVDGEALSPWLGAFLRTFEWNQLDAFPSGHTALSLVYLVLGWRSFPRWRVALLVITPGIIFATVYLSLHYVVDLVAGAAVGLVMLPGAPALHRLLVRDQRPSSNARHAPSAQPIRSKRPPR
jgi:membrane-associated phospholipid phosphatase